MPDESETTWLEQRVRKRTTELEKANEALRESQKQLSAELDAMQRLQDVSTRLIQADNIQDLYELILETAIALMHADFASMQMLETDGEPGESRGILRLLGWRGFHPLSARFWETVSIDSMSTCGAALRNCERLVVTDVEQCAMMAGTRDLDEYRRSGIQSVQSTPLISRSGQLLGMISTHWRQPYEPPEGDLRQLDILARQAADLIERKLAESERERLLLAEQEARRVAEAAVRVRDEFLSVAAHELKTPVTSLSGFAQTLLRGYERQGAVDPRRLVRALQVIDQQSSKLERLVSELLDLSRLEGGRLVLQRQSVDLANLVEEVVTTARLSTTRHTFVVEAPARTTAFVDPVRIEQVIGNLVDNAIRYSPDGGRVEITVSVINETVLLTVRDHGIGISPERQPHVFDRLYRAHSGGSIAGLGLGLYISREIVSLHQGTIDVACPPDGGTVFRVSLPLGDGLSSGNTERQGESG